MKINWKFLAVLLFFVLFYSFALSKYPLVWVDEPWLAELSWNMARHGQFTSSTFTGYFSYDILVIPYLGYHLLLSLVFKLFGLGVIQARLLSLISSFFILIVVYHITKLLYKDNKNAGIIAMCFLIANPIFFQCARQSRQEALIALFIVSAFYFMARGIKEQKLYNYFICGAFIALSFLSHYNGLIAGVTMFLIILFHNKKAVLVYTAGALLFVLPYILFILVNFQLFKEQMLIQCGDRILFIPYLFKNLINEYIRWMHPSLIIPLIIGVSALIYLIITNYKKQSLLINYIILFYVLLALIDSARKPFLYLNLIFPFLAIAAAIAFFEIYKKRKVLATVSLIILLIGSGIFLPYKLFKYLHSDYYGVINKFKKEIPQGSVVIGIPTYWFGIDDYYKYRSYDLIYHNAKIYNTDYDKALKLIKGDYIIYDESWAPSYKTKETQALLNNSCELKKVIYDKYYGQGYDGIIRPDNIKIYKVKKPDKVKKDESL
ncbi:MAG: glycosyltransferase family 39 protein [Armatimonadota bacterium]